MTPHTISARLQQLYAKALIAYHQRGPRERQFLLASLALIGITLFYILALKPASDFNQHARAALDQEQRLLNFVRENADAVKQFNAARQAKTGNDTSLLALASKTAADHQLILQRYEPAENKLSVWLSEANFNEVLSWMDQLTHDYRVQIERVNITASTKAGAVEVQLILRQ